jgi:hypothetical protein
MATAIWKLNAKDRTGSEIKSAFKYISEARKLMPSEKKFDAIFNEIKVEHDAVVKREMQA